MAVPTARHPLDVAGCGTPPVADCRRASLEDGPELYETFNDKDDDCVKVVLEP